MNYGGVMNYGMMIAADQFSTLELQEIARNAERSGVDNLWVPELFGRDPFVTCASLLSATENLRVGTAITNIYARDARAIKSAAYSLAEAHGNRFELGIGLSNKTGNDQRGLPWVAPSKKLAEFIHYYNASPLMFDQNCDVSIYLAAHGPTLMNIAAEKLDGAYVYLKPVEYSQWAKAQLGAKKLHLMQITVLESDPEIARGIARKAISIYMPLTNYHRAWREAGFADEDFSSGGSDHFIDSLIAWGDLEKVRQRYQLQMDSGVDQIIISPANLNLLQTESWQTIESLIAVNS